MLPNASVYLSEPVFSHGQLYVFTPIFKVQMECIILCAPRDQSHIR
jgi:hypothetical protein